MSASTCVYQTTDDVFLSVVTAAPNIRQALIALGLEPKGGNYGTLKARCQRLGIEPPQPKDKRIRKYISDEDISQACSKFTSRMSVLRFFGLNPEAGSNIKWLQSAIERLPIDTKHWLGQGHLKGKTHSWSKKKTTRTNAG